MARHNRIDLGPASENLPQVEEALASVAIIPGTYVYLDTSGEFAPLTTALNVAGRQGYIASENFVQGRDVNDTNPADQSMIAQYGLERKRYAALLLAGQNITVLDTPLTISATAGVLEIGTPGTDRIVAYAREVFNNSGATNELIAIRPAVQ